MSRQPMRQLDEEYHKVEHEGDNDEKDQNRRQYVKRRQQVRNKQANKNFARELTMENVCSAIGLREKNVGVSYLGHGSFGDVFRMCAGNCETSPKIAVKYNGDIKDYIGELYGMAPLTYMNELSPHYQYLLGYFTCERPPPFVVTRMGRGIANQRFGCILNQLYDSDLDRKFTDILSGNIRNFEVYVFQVLFSILLLRKYYDFQHSDLQLKNVFLVNDPLYEPRKRIFRYYKLNDRVYKIPVVRYLTVIADTGEANYNIENNTCPLNYKLYRDFKQFLPPQFQESVSARDMVIFDVDRSKGDYVPAHVAYFWYGHTNVFYDIHMFVSSLSQHLMLTPPDGALRRLYDYVFEDQTLLPHGKGTWFQIRLNKQKFQSGETIRKGVEFSLDNIFPEFVCHKQVRSPLWRRFGDWDENIRNYHRKIEEDTRLYALRQRQAENQVDKKIRQNIQKIKTEGLDKYTVHQGQTPIVDVFAGF